jgi:hypothetical protein
MEKSGFGFGIKMLSTGQPSTLGNYLILCRLVFGRQSRQAQFIEDKIADSPKGENEEVIADESQMLHLLGNLK